MIVGIIGLFIPLFRLIDVRSVVIILVTTLISGFLSGLTTPINFALLADNTDYVELQLNQRTEGAIASSASFITKCAMGIGGAIPGYFLAWAGFDGQAAVQTGRVNTVIIVCNIIVPIVFSMIALFIFSKYPLTKKKLVEQNELLAKKRAGESKLNQY